MLSPVKDTMVPQNNSGQCADAKSNNIGEFDLVMAAMQLLIMAGPSTSMQAQNDVGVGSANGTVNLELLEPYSISGLIKDEALESTLIDLQVLNTPAGALESAFGKAVEQVLEGAELSPGLPATPVLQFGSGQAAMADTDQAVVLNQAQLLQQSTPGYSNDVQTPLAQAGLKQVIDNGANPGIASFPEQNETKVSPAVGEINQVVLDQQAALKAGVAGNNPQPKQKENINIFETRTIEAQTIDETTQAVGKEPGVNNQKAQFDLAQLEEFKSVTGTEPGHALETSPQPQAVLKNPTLAAGNLADSSKTVTIPGLKDWLAQEIKHILTAGKDEQLRQLQIKLEPEHLGQLTIKLYFNNDVLNAHFYTGNNQVKEILEGSLLQLRDSLSQYDLSLNEALVFTGDDSRGGAGSSFEDSNGQWQAYHGYNSRTYADVQVKPVNTPAITTDSARVNYLI